MKSGEPLRTFMFEAPMTPLDVARNMYLDYTTTQSIEFYNKRCEKLPGDPFNGKMLMTWLVQVQDKANMFTWTSILTIKGKLLTQYFTELTMEEVRAHAQIYQDRSSREAQNAERLIQCLKGIHLKASVQQSLPANGQIHHLQKEYIRANTRWSMLLKDHH
jgi:hypothetical protein